MAYTEIVEHDEFTNQSTRLIEKYPRLNEVIECAGWEIGKDYRIFPRVEGANPEELYVWRSDDSDIEDLPTIEIAYYYSLDDGLIHFIGIRPISE